MSQVNVVVAATAPDIQAVTIAGAVAERADMALVAVASRSDLEDALGIVQDEIVSAALWATALGAFVGLVVALPLLGILTYVLLDEWGDDEVRETVQRTGEVSDSIFSTYLIPFEAVGFLLTAALIGAIVLARKE